MAGKCKKCGKDLPNNYNGDICGYCKNQEIDNVKKGAGIAMAILGVISAAAKFLIFKK